MYLLKGFLRRRFCAQSSLSILHAAQMDEKYTNLQSYHKHIVDVLSSFFFKATFRRILPWVNLPSEPLKFLASVGILVKTRREVLIHE